MTHINGLFSDDARNIIPAKGKNGTILNKHQCIFNSGLTWHMSEPQTMLLDLFLEGLSQSPGPGAENSQQRVLN